jgi:hypothetical protein
MSRSPGRNTPHVHWHRDIVLLPQNMLLADDNIHLDARSSAGCPERFLLLADPETSKILRKGIAPRARSAAVRTIGSFKCKVRLVTFERVLSRFSRKASPKFPHTAATYTCVNAFLLH